MERSLFIGAIPFKKNKGRGSRPKKFDSKGEGALRKLISRGVGWSPLEINFSGVGAARKLNSEGGRGA